MFQGRKEDKFNFFMSIFDVHCFGVERVGQSKDVQVSIRME